MGRTSNTFRYQQRESINQVGYRRRRKKDTWPRSNGKKGEDMLKDITR